jgi:predicted nucleic acid-binding protein
MILVDANVLMYASGAGHPNKESAVAFLRRVAEGEVEAVVDAEVLQEVIHRYTSLQRWDEGREVYSIARFLFPEVLAISGAVVDKAKVLVDELGSLTARDAVHASVVSV